MLVFLLSALPGVFAVWSGKRLVALADDPALPERLQEHRRRLMQVTVGTVVVVTAVSWPWGPWVAPLPVLCALAGGFPARRALLEEEWALPAYLSHVVRFTVAGAGFWMVLAFAPAVIGLTGPFSAVVGAVLCGGLLAWNHRGRDVFLHLARATPLERPDLVSRLAVVRERSTAEPPRLYVAGSPGARWANAFALPSLRGSAVLFTRTLLELFDPDEIAAIFGHEVAHLEHFDRRRLRRLYAVGAAMALGATAVPVLLPANTATVFLWLWPFLVVLVLLSAVSDRKAHEAESDRRAVALCGDGEALIRALAKLTTLARLPRRWDAETERAASHPSLAQRVRAIRETAGAQPPELGSAVVARSTAEGTYVVLEAGRVSWLEGVPVGTPPEAAALRERAARSRSLKYGELAELHVRARLARPATLVARGREGRAWSTPIRTPIRTEDVPALQTALETVDVKPPSPRPGLLQPVLVQLVAGLALLAAIVSREIGVVLLPGVVGLLRGTTAVLSATGAAALLALRTGRTGGDGLTELAALGAVGILALALTLFRARREEVSERSRDVPILLAVLAVGTLLATAPLVLAGLSSPASVRLHQAARARPGVVVGLAAIVAVLLAAGGRRRRIAAAVALTLAAATLALGSHDLLLRFGRDPFFAAVAPLPLDERSLAVVRKVELPGQVMSLRLSPSGARHAVQLVGASTSRAIPPFRVGELDVAATDLAFLDDDRVLALVEGRGAPELRMIAIESDGRPVWAQAVPEIDEAELEVESETGEWWITGSLSYGGQAVILSGKAGAEGVTERRWDLPLSPSDPGIYRAVVSSSPVALAVKTSYAVSLHPLAILAATSPPFARSELWLLEERGARRLLSSGLEASCLREAGGRFPCLAFDGERTLVWSVDAPGETSHPAGSLPGRVLSSARGPAGTIAVLNERREVFLVDLPSGRAARVRVPASGPAPYVLAVGRGGVVGVLLWRRHRSTLTVGTLAPPGTP